MGKWVNEQMVESSIFNVGLNDKWTKKMAEYSVFFVVLFLVKFVVVIEIRVFVTSVIIFYSELLVKNIIS